MTFAQRFFGRLSVPVFLLFIFLVMALPLLAQAASTLGQNPAMVNGLHLKPASAIVKVGGTLKLDLVYCQVAGKVAEKETGNKPKGKSNDKPIGKSAEDELAPLPFLKLSCEGDDDYAGNDDHGIPLAQLEAPADVKWKVVDGPGRVIGDKDGATYHAPASKPTLNQATVEVTFKYPLRIGGKSYPDAKQTLLSRITILDEVKTYTGTFTLHDVSVDSEYTTDLAGNIKWDFDEYYDIGGWREYTGTGKAAYSIKRISCSGPASFSGVPVEGRMKVYDDKRYEFLINLVSEDEMTKICRRDDFKWEETYSPGGGGMSSGDPCATSESYEHYDDITNLTFARNGSCDNVINRFQHGWSFKAVN